ncbi:MAG: VOC family protein [Desulfarculales bacterium]|jgi:catechol 2,3-dioxygenase-like lactoylglutathione lyase family enzyme|nr:VOC family protein [Desulfarculales bacterium]
MIKDHHHIHIRCQDLLLSHAFYVDILGGRELKHYFTKKGTEIYLVLVGDTTLALSPQKGELDRPLPDTQPVGLFQIAYRVEDVKQALDEFARRGGKIKGGIIEATPGVWAGFVQGPDGVEIELMQE